MRRIYTIGYSNRSFEEFVNLIREYGVERVIDIRRWSSSLRNPAYSYSSLSKTLLQNNIDYIWIPELGGYRKFGLDVEDYGIASCFESEGFRAYATYITMSSSVKPYLRKLIELVNEKVSVLMCCEKNPYRCHRKILSDYLVAKGFEVVHILDYGKTIKHELSRCAVVVDCELKYT